MPASLDVRFADSIQATLDVSMVEVTTWAPERYNQLVEALGTLIDLVHSPKWRDPTNTFGVGNSTPMVVCRVDEAVGFERHDGGVREWPEPHIPGSSWSEDFGRPPKVSDGDVEGPASEQVAPTPVGDDDRPEPESPSRQEDSAGTPGEGQRAEPPPAAPTLPDPMTAVALAPKAKKPAARRDPAPLIEVLGAPTGTALAMLRAVEAAGGCMEVGDEPLHRTLAARIEVGAPHAMSVLSELIEKEYLAAERQGRRITALDLTKSGEKAIRAARR